MASIGKEAGGFRILFVDPSSGRRKTVRLGHVTRRQAEAVKVKVEALLASMITGHAPDEEVSRWLAGLDGRLVARLARVGLVAKRTTETLGTFLKRYASERIDVKPATQALWGYVQRNLVEHFGAEKLLRQIGPGDADGFKMYLVGLGLAPTTIRRRLQFVRQFFRAALRRKLIDTNVFAEVGTPAAADSGRQRFITREQTAKILDVCPDATWRVITVLARYGGLRCPSAVSYTHLTVPTNREV